MTCNGWKTTALALAVLGCAGLAATPASADKGNGKGSGRGGEKSQHEEMFDHDSKSWIRIGIDNDDRDDIRRWLSNDFRRNCPPGLAKKNNGCMPPGQAKKYRIGEPLPDGVRWNPLPRDLLDLLDPPPRGHQYVQVDTDILLIGEAGKKVIDAVTLLSAVGQ